MIAFSDRPERKVRLSSEARLAVELANAYLNGHLPESGGWLDQDSYYVRLIELALGSRSARKAAADRKRERRQRSVFGRRKRK